MKTHAICRTPLVGCLKEASNYANIPFDWKPINQEQEEFKRHLELNQETENLTEEEFESIAANDSAIINKWLKDKGFDISLPKLKEEEFATASVMKIAVQWSKKAVKTKLRTQEQSYDAVFFYKEIGKQIQADNQTWATTELQTQDENTQVFVAMPDEYKDWTEEELITITKTIQEKYQTAHQHYKNVQMPMIDLDVKVEQQWILGMKCESYRIIACVQQFILKLNEKGAVAKSAAGMSLAKAACMDTTPTLTFNKPFVLWFVRKGITYPLFIAMCGHDCWNAPKDLE
jgi:mRNA-degrading endonuclease HigB of HigAB toxin-antitoxin module